MPGKLRTFRGGWRAIAVAAGIAVTGFGGAPVARGVGAISGRIVNGTTQELAGVWVDAYTTATNLAGSAYTSGTNGYTISGLAAGQYYVRTDAGSANYIDEWYPDARVDGAAIPAGATRVTVTDGATTPNINIALAQGASISGRVTGASGGALSNVWVDAYDTDANRLGSALTSSTGQYTIAGLDGGTYCVRTDAYGLNVVDEWFNDVTVRGSDIPTNVTLIVLQTGDTEENIDFALAAGGRVTGRVTDTSANGLTNIWVDVYDADGRWLDSAASDATGAYRVLGLPAGLAYARTYAGALNYADEWYDNVPVLGWDRPATAAPVVVLSGSTASNVSFALARGGTITGYVRRSGGAAVPGVRVDAYNANDAWQASADTDAAGLYRIQGLPAASFRLRTEVGALNLIDEWYTNVAAVGTLIADAALAVAVTAGGTVSGIGFALDAGGVIRGTVQNGVPQPLAGVRVELYESAGSNWVADATSGTNGVYSAVGLSSGYYLARTFSGDLNYVDEWYHNVPATGDVVPAGVALVPATAGATNAGVDFALAAGGTVSGRVTNASSAPLTGVEVGVFNADGIELGDALSAYDGHYRVTRLAAGPVYVRTDAGTQNVVDEWYRDVTAVGIAIPAGASAIGVPAGAVTGNVDFALDAGAVVTGTVRTVGGAAIEDATVDVYDAQTNWLSSAATDAAGGYRVAGLPAPRQACVRTYASGLGYADEWYDNEPVLAPGIPDAARRLVLASGATTGSIAFALAAAGTIQGSVRDAAGSALRDIDVDLYSGAGAWLRTARTGASGAFAFGGLPAARFHLRTYSGAAWFRDEWYDDLPVAGAGLPAGADGVDVAAGATSGPVAFALGHALAGVVVTGGHAAIEWQAASGTTYQVQESGDLRSWSNAPSGAGADQQSLRGATAQDLLRYVSPGTPAPPRYYRVRIAP